jgi:hypothetical protein
MGVSGVMVGVYLPAIVREITPPQASQLIFARVRILLQAKTAMEDTATNTAVQAP